MNLTYRQKLRMKKALKWCGILLSVLIVSLVLFLIFVERYVVYTPDGVRIDYSRSAAQLQATEPTEPSVPQLPKANVVYETPMPSPEDSEQMFGYLLTADQLKNAEELLGWAAELEKGSTVLMELKDPSGLLFYNSNLAGAERAAVNTDAVEQLIIALRKNSCTPVAMVSAFADDHYAVAHPEAALQTEEGDFWIGSHNAYWLDPANENVTVYLEQIASELSNRGFMEVVFADFCFPDTSAIAYEADRSRWELLVDAANRVIGHFSETNLAVSFLITEPDFPAECLRGRLYVRHAEAATIDRFVSSYQSERWDAKKSMIFITSSRDSRFNDYGTLVPFS